MKSPFRSNGTFYTAYFQYCNISYSHLYFRQLHYSINSKGCIGLLKGITLVIYCKLSKYIFNPFLKSKLNKDKFQCLLYSVKSDCRFRQPLFVKAFYYPLYAFSLTTTDALLSVVSSFDNNRCTGNYAAAYKQQGKP